MNYFCYPYHGIHSAWLLGSTSSATWAQWRESRWISYIHNGTTASSCTKIWFWWLIEEIRWWSCTIVGAIAGIAVHVCVTTDVRGGTVDTSVATNAWLAAHTWIATSICTGTLVNLVVLVREIIIRCGGDTSCGNWWMRPRWRRCHFRLWRRLFKEKYKWNIHIPIPIDLS